MKRSILTVIALLAFFALYQINAQAQDRWSLEFRPGIDFATKDIADADLGTGFGFEGTISYRFMPHLAAYAGWSWNHFGVDQSFAGTDASFGETGYTFGLQFIHPIGESNISYLVRAGGTYNHIEIENNNGDIIIDSGHGLGWKDTVLVNPNETISVLTKFNDYSGIYLLHCHNLEHEDDGMMLNIQIDSSTRVDDENSNPKSFELYQNYPNPFNPTTTIKYRINSNAAAKVKLDIYDASGSLVEKLFEGRQSNGEYSFIWNASHYSSGNYFARLEVNKILKLIKLVLVK